MVRSLTFRRFAFLTLLAAGGVFVDAKVLPRWFPQAFGGVWGGLAAPDNANVPASLRDLPVVVIKGKRDDGPVAILLSGNGGWWGIDDGIAEGLARAGVTTIGLNSLAYFIHRRSPEEVAAAIDRMAAAIGPGRPVVLVGYSFGADIAATIYARLSDDLRARIRQVSLLGLSREADYAVGFMKVAGGRRGTIPAVAAIDGPHIQCFHGADEGARSGCNDVDAGKVQVVEVPGGHHFDGDYDRIASLILDGMPSPPPNDPIRYAGMDRFAWLAHPAGMDLQAGKHRND
ncbi:alpha/beta fold hydrolase [Labrys sp. ZIDIC5]|uniref:alpha/beta fold hydrolase n=1 Tax=Labrys sedimenti TaxID=3106036 RepID=UPI002ACADCFC|nr:alpha/beta fold hydrolase [Labrys sp. ZIDIC5]MDZ5450340.1 alpha/beta fold hydrolase [Labrys sp. ZIDIC5]